VSALGGILVNKIVFEFVEIGVEATERQGLGHSALTRSAFYMNDYVQRLGNVCFEGDIGDFNPALQDTSTESRNALGSGIGVDGRNGSAVTRVEER
jgi:hypothetical protein